MAGCRELSDGRLLALLAALGPACSPASPTFEPDEVYGLSVDEEVSSCPPFVLGTILHERGMEDLPVSLFVPMCPLGTPPSPGGFCSFPSDTLTFAVQEADDSRSGDSSVRVEVRGLDLILTGFQDVEQGWAELGGHGELEVADYYPPPYSVGVEWSWTSALDDEDDGFSGWIDVEVSIDYSGWCTYSLEVTGRP